MNIPIFLSSDNNYAPFVATTIASICDNTKSFCDFYVLDGGITEENQKKICELKNQFNNFSIEFIFIHEGILSNINYKNSAVYVSIATYNRFLMSKLKPNLGKALYLDVDIIALDDITKLYHENLEEYSIAAVPELFSNRYDMANIKERSQVLELKSEHQYFNAGVLLINLQEWVRDKISEKLFQTEELMRNKLKFADQDVLNIYFNGLYKVLDRKYNFMTQNYCEGENIVIRHYTAQLKPWQVEENIETDLLYHIKNFWYYAKKTAFYSELQSKIIYETSKDLIKYKVSKLIREKNA